MFHYLLQRVIWIIIRLLFASIKIEYKNPEVLEVGRNQHPKRVFIFAIWHENVVAVMMGHAWSGPMLSMASRSRDGDYAAYVAQKLGYIAVRGSSKKRGKDKGGRAATETYISMFNQGHSGGITVDGPKGPRRKCKAGVVYIAQQTGCAIVPVAGVASSFWEFHSWDRFKVPKPFSKITITYGNPIKVAKSCPLEDLPAVCLEVGEALNQLDGLSP